MSSLSVGQGKMPYSGLLTIKRTRDHTGNEVCVYSSWSLYGSAHWNQGSYHFIQSVVTIIKQMDNSQGWERQRETAALIRVLVETQNEAVALENQPTIHQRVKCRFTTQFNNLIPGYETKRMENVYLHKNCVHKYSEELDSPWSKRGNNPSVRHLMNG